METSESTTAILPAILAAKKAMRPVQKGGENTFDNYKYSQEIDWWKAVRKPLEANDLIIAFSVMENIELGPTISGKQTKTRVIGKARIMHALSSEWIEIWCMGDGADKGDKAIFKAMTGLKKYAYSLLLGLPTSDDPELQTEADPAPKTRKPKAAAPAKPITTDERREVQDYLREHADMLAEDLVTWVNKVASLPGSTSADAKKAMSKMAAVVRKMTKTPPKKLHDKINVMGRELYGEQWNTKRHGMVGEITNGLFESMTDMSPDQLSTLCERLESMSPSMLEPSSADSEATSEVFHKP